MDATFWALMPPIVAIVLALITKEVYVSLLIGIWSGGRVLRQLPRAGRAGNYLRHYERAGGKQHQHYYFPGAFGNAGGFNEQVRRFPGYGTGPPGRLRPSGAPVRHRGPGRFDFRGRLF